MRTLITKRNLILGLVILIACFLRFYKLSEYPIQLNHDEISQLYDTGSIIQTKKDIYGNFLPLAFPSTGDYKVGHYIYISTIPYYLLGNSEVIIRIPAAFFGTLTVLGVFLFIRVLTNNWLLAILSAVMVTITPSEIFYARKSFENVIGVCLDFFGLYFLLNGLSGIKRRAYGFIGVFFLILATYIYTSQTIIVPLLILLTFTIFQKEIFSKRKYLVSLILAAFILMIPLILLTVVDPGLRFRAASVFVSQDVNLGKTIDLNGNILKSYIDIIFTKFLNQLDPFYLFVNGLDFTNQSIFGVGPLLIWQFPLVIIGIIFLIKNQALLITRNILFVMVAISFIPSAITFENYSPHRAMLGFVIISIISAFGLYWLVKLVPNLRAIIKIPILIFLFLSLILNLTYFLRMYTGSYPFEKSQKMQYPFKQIAQYAWSQYDAFDQIVFDPKFGLTTPIIGVGAHYYFAYYGNIPPEKFQKDYKTNDKKRELTFDKFSIREVYWPADKDLKNTLVIVSPWSVPLSDVDQVKIIKRFYFYDGQLAFYAVKL